MELWQRLFGKDERNRMDPLYRAVVAEARQPAWYRDGGVPDTLDGRFDMVAAVLSLVLLRLEAGGEPGRAPAAWLTELFVADMDGQLREQGIGDIVVGKHVGRMMGALGGRLGAFRAALDAGDLGAAIDRNLYRGEAPSMEARRFTQDRLSELRSALAASPLDRLVAGEWPR